MNEIKLVDLQDIALPNWLPNTYIQALADVITNTGFVPPIIVLDDELLTPDVVAALRTIKARNEAPDAAVPFIPLGIAVMDTHWLVKVDRRISKTEVKYETIHHYHDDWWRFIKPYTITWQDAYWTYNNSFSTGGTGGVALSASASWNPENPLLVTSVNSGSTASIIG